MITHWQEPYFLIRLTNERNQADKNTDIELDNFKKEARGLDPIEVKTATAKMKMKSRERNKFGIQVDQPVITKPKLRFKGSPQNPDKFPYYEILGDRQQLKLHNSARKSWVIPVPKHDVIYYHREFLLMYDDLKKDGETGLNNLIKGLKKTNLLVWSFEAFEPKAYVDNDHNPEYLPPPDQQIVKKGRKRILGVWQDKPNNLSKGALQAYKLAQIILDSPDVYPIDASYITSYNAHGYRYIKGIGAISNQSKVGKISKKHGNLHALKKSQASWSEADEADYMFKSINVKEIEINAANGARGRKCIHISVTKDQCPSGFIPVHVPGLGAGLEMKPSWDENDYGIVMFVVGKTEEEHRHDEDPVDEEVSNSLRMTQFLLNKIFDPFIRDQRVGNRHSIPFKEGVVVEEKNSVKLAVDSDVNMMKLMKRQKIVDRYSTNKVVLQNHAAGYTECGSANDLQQLHKNTKREMQSSTCESEETRLKKIARAMMKKLKQQDELNVPSWMQDTIVDCIATNNGANDRACNANIIKKGYLLTGEVLRQTGGRGINSCPDLYETIKIQQSRRIIQMISSKSYTFVHAAMVNMGILVKNILTIYLKKMALLCYFQKIFQIDHLKTKKRYLVMDNTISCVLYCPIGTISCVMKNCVARKLLHLFLAASMSFF